LTPGHIVAVQKQVEKRGRMSNVGAGLWPSEVAALYGIPPEWDGAGQCIGIVALGGSYHPDDLTDACKQMGRPKPLVVPVSVPVNGVMVGYSNGTQGDEEATLDLQVVAGIAPGARIVVYCAPDTEDGLAAALLQALGDSTNKPSVISISYAIPEPSLTDDGFIYIEGLLAQAAGLGVSVVAAAGDLLADAGRHDGGAYVAYPASSSFVIGCGGTQIVLTPDGKAIAEETVWNDGISHGTDGGRSRRVGIPNYQTNIQLPQPAKPTGTGRGVPDVAAAAGERPGYRIVLAGSQKVTNGTSAATPLWAALIALANAKRGKPLAGEIHPFLYANSQANLALKQILQGNNRWQDVGYYAGPGWNACTGWGAPKGADTINALAAIPQSAGNQP
jgi:kumamolisin